MLDKVLKKNRSLQGKLAQILSNERLVWKYLSANNIII